MIYGGIEKAGYLDPPDRPNTALLRPKDPGPSNKSSPSSPIIASPNGDMILKYSRLSSAETYYWKINSHLLVNNSPYFRVLIDPDKFSEGRLLAQQRTESAASDSLPIMVIPATPFTEMCGVDAIEIFLQILCLDSLTAGPNADEDDDLEALFTLNLKTQPLSLIARLIAISDWYSSPKPVKDALQRVDYNFGKGNPRLNKFDKPSLKMTDDRIRQTIAVATFMGLDNITKIMTHTLVVLGSKRWAHGLELPSDPYLPWQYFAHGLEDELYFRRQCILNTITDLQAHFLRKYGALEDTEETKPPASAITTHSFSQHRPFQCRAGLGNASQCDLFHLGQMTRFFALRAKTIFVGSTLIDPEFSPMQEEVEDGQEMHDGSKEQPSATLSVPESDITALIASMKRFPDYQVDLNHQGCGVRRRLLPILDGIEKFVLDGRGLLGVMSTLWQDSSKRLEISWKLKPRQTIPPVDIQSVYLKARGPRPSQTLSQEDYARVLFTAKKRIWEAHLSG
ncbi:uncharacterized protein N7482_006090 [Penicillium canariense]|uniref:BTB domain-containing protein n=1 Tax=Penicillium canariense TaxID=189055 RepID=A0A9W9I3L1_9EURO|nr:uncharacterized protein N7482_006090 [Penicillium canariense]KAJ5167309.1 hypothetical protein N7482_006090 [Penicillium canariense]